MQTIHPSSPREGAVSYTYIKTSPRIHPNKKDSPKEAAKNMAQRANHKKDKSVEALTKLAQENYYAYTFLALNEGIDFSKQKPRFKPTKFHRWLCDTVWEFVVRETPNPYDILLLSVPPQHGKSKHITETLPSFYLGHFPEHRVIEASYGQDLAKQFGRANKSKVEHFGGLFGIKVSKDAKSVVDWKLENGIGGMISRGLLSGITGQPGNLIIIDDPIKNSEEAQSVTVREKIFEEWTTSVLSRVQANSKIIVIQTRWHEDDLIGRLKDDPYAVYYNLEAICETENDLLGRKIGEALCPEIGKDEKWLLAFKDAMIRGEVDEGGETGQRAWEALYQGHPTSREGNLIQREWWQFYEGIVKDMDTMIMSVDPAFKDTGDYVAIEIWGKKGPNIYLIDLLKAHLNFQATMKAIVQRRALYPVDYVLVEDKANGSAVIETLRRAIPGIIAVTPKDSKVERVNAVSFAIEAGNVYLPRDKKFTAEFISECAQFPNGKHDDTVDAMTQALGRLIWSNKRVRRERNILDEFGFSKPKKLGYGKGDKIHVI